MNSSKLLVSTDYKIEFFSRILGITLPKLLNFFKYLHFFFFLRLQFLHKLFSLLLFALMTQNSLINVWMSLLKFDILTYSLSAQTHLFQNVVILHLQLHHAILLQPKSGSQGQCYSCMINKAKIGKLILKHFFVCFPKTFLILLKSAQIIMLLGQ